MRALRRAAIVTAYDHVVALDGDGDGTSTLVEPHAACEEICFERGRNLGVLAGQHLLAAHDERDLATERLEHVHELDAGDAGPNDDEVLGDARWRVRVACGEHAHAVRRSPYGDARTATRAQHDDVGVELARAVRGIGPHGVRVEQRGAAADELDALARQQLGDGPLELVLDAS